MAALGLDASNCGVALKVSADASQMRSLLQQVSESSAQQQTALSKTVAPLTEKWDWCLPADVLRDSFISKSLDLSAASEWLQKFS